MAINNLKAPGYDIKYKVDFNNYLGFKVEKQKDGVIKLTQPHLMKEIVREVKLNHRATTRQTSAVYSKILHIQENKPSH